MTLKLHELAKQDLFAGEEFYEQIAPGLGAYFSESLESDLDDLLQHHSDDSFNYLPQSFQDYLIARSSKFPWSIYYRKEDDSLVVQAILDQRFSPERIQQILGTRPTNQ